MVFSNSGYCSICEQDTDFRATDQWFRDYYLCRRCGTAPRQRAVVEVLNAVAPRWRDSSIHESSPCIDFFERECRGYTRSYFFEEAALGSDKDGQRCENLERLTFPDNTFDVFLTQDVLEHVFRPDLAVREIARVLKPGGVHVFTAPKHKHLLKSYPRARQVATGEIEYLLPAEYHGNPIGDGRSLVTWDYGSDFDDLLTTWSGYLVSDYVIRDRARGIDGEYLDVFVMRKDIGNRPLGEPSKRADTPVWYLEVLGQVSGGGALDKRELQVSGWAVDAESKKSAGGIDVIIDDTLYPSQTGGLRPDVAEYFGTPGYGDSGFVLRLPPGQLALGTHSLRMRIIAWDGQSYWEVGPYTLDVK